MKSNLFIERKSLTKMFICHLDTNNYWILTGIKAWENSFLHGNSDHALLYLLHSPLVFISPMCKKLDLWSTLYILSLSAFLSIPYYVLGLAILCYLIFGADTEIEQTFISIIIYLWNNAGSNKKHWCVVSIVNIP